MEVEALQKRYCFATLLRRAPRRQDDALRAELTRVAEDLSDAGGARPSAPPPPLPRTNRTSLVPPLVLSGHAASLTPY